MCVCACATSSRVKFAGLVGSGAGRETDHKTKKDNFGFGLGNHYAECYPG